MILVVVVSRELDNPLNEDGQLVGYAFVGDIVFGSIVVIVNIKLIMESHQLDWGLGILSLGSTVVYLVAHALTSILFKTYDHFGVF